MSVVNKGIKWQYVAGIGVICGLAVVGCSRSDKEDTAKATDAESIVDNSTAPPAIACDDPLVQDRLNTALKTTLNRQAQSLATNYASDARINLDGGVVTSKIDGIIIEVQNATMSQEANANGLTTCQASVSMTLASEDLYQASQVQAANNQPNLQTRLAQDNIRVNNNMLVDDAFTYVVSKQDGQVQVRIAGQSALVAAVADVMASSAYQAVIDNLRAARTAQQAANRAQQAVRRAGQEAVRSAPVQNRTTQPQVAPREPTQLPSVPPTIVQENTQTIVGPNGQVVPTPSANNRSPSVSTEPSAPTPEDDSIDMVIIEDKNATY